MEFKIVNQGKPRVNCAPALVVASSESIVAFEIDMHSKWCEVDATSSGPNGGLAVHVGTMDRSCHLDETKDLPWTEIEFPDYKCNEWDIFAAECCRYTLRVVLTKR